MIDGHVFFTGREYVGPHKEVLNRPNVGNPTPTKLDMMRSWEKVLKEVTRHCGCDLPESEWRTMMEGCMTQPRQHLCTRTNPSTRAVYQMRKGLSGMVIGELDKNNGECWVCCPTLYEEALRGMYTSETGYEPVFPRKLTAYQAKKYRDPSKLTAYVLNMHKGQKRQVGSEDDVLKAWGREYRAKGWHKYAKFNPNGGFNKPYILFKAKNVIDPEVRKRKWKKVRPIAPGTKHPARDLLGLVGRAWSFVTSRLPGEHFVLNKCQDVPEFFREAEKKLSPLGDFTCIVKDIEGCFPNMPKPIIRQALRSYAKQIEEKWGFEGVIVPKYAKSKPCEWLTRNMRGKVFLSFEVMLDVVDFALENTLVKLDGRLLKQVLGIPMGGPTSPGMTVGTCAWMEQEWLANLTKGTKRFFCAKRYMDDICMFVSESSLWDKDRFVKDFCESECYMPPLKLEDGDQSTFLETSFTIQDKRVEHCLKNVNPSDGPPKVWRYHKMDSYCPFAQKRALLISTLKKVDKMANTKDLLRQSAMQKLAEFEKHGYSRGMRRMACALLATTTAKREWLDVRDAQ